MHYKNDKMLPLYILRGIQQSWQHSKGDAEFSVTELLQPPKVRALRLLNKDAIVEDYSDSIASFIGTSVHKMLEDGNKDKEEYITESPLSHVFKDITVGDDTCKVSGTVDLIDIKNYTLVDFKTTGAYGVMYDKPEWEQQLNIYGYLYAKQENKKTLPTLEISAILKDWSKNKAEKSNTYPPSPVYQKPIVSWNMEKVEDFVKERIRLHRVALEEPDMFDCSDEERWLSPKGVYNRCKHYCNVNQFCNQYKGEINGGEQNKK
tara:strand:+ start:3652 stop:4437 length:786 start_codon:yes stop_codon:yes gene_type:complete